ncbi:MAG: CNNM domain-containing protein, partial [Duncaniella sp.]|nr:CNNM domain-containing protein [Duncaniella sp.]
MDTDPLPAAEALSTLINGLASMPLLAIPAMDASQIVALAIAILALIVSGFVSGSEIAFFSLTPVQYDQLEEEGDRGARVLSLVGRPERLLATILIANNLVNVTIVVLCNFALGPVFEGMSELWSFVLQTILLTFLILLFGEILPKLYANSNNLAWARMATGPLSLAVKMFYPLSSVLVKSSVIVNKVVPKHSDSVTADDLSQALEITAVDSEQDKGILEGILKFGDTTASEVMTPRVDVTGLDMELTFAEVMKVVIDSGFARLPVYEETMDNIKGVLYSRDLLPYVGKTEAAGFRWQSLMR